MKLVTCLCKWMDQITKDNVDSTLCPPSNKAGSRPVAAYSLEELHQ